MHIELKFYELKLLEKMVIRRGIRGSFSRKESRASVGVSLHVWS